jgi:hypothetical protein
MPRNKTTDKFTPRLWRSQFLPVELRKYGQKLFGKGKKKNE